MLTAADTQDDLASQAALAEAIKRHARELGFDLVGITSAAAPATLASFESWLERGFAGEMSYLENRQDAYAHPAGVLPGVKSIVLLAMNYNSGGTFEGEGDLPPAFRVSQYAWGKHDYHDVVRERMRSLADEDHRLHPGCRTAGTLLDGLPTSCRYSWC